MSPESFVAVRRARARSPLPLALFGATLVVGAGRSAAAQAVTAGEGTRGSDERGALQLGGGEGVSLTLGGYLQVDGRWISGARLQQPDGLLLRRARLVFDAALSDGWHVRLQPDFGQGRVLIQDAFVARERGAMLFRAGRFRPAFGTERMQSSSTLLSPERGIVNSLMPSRSFGAQLQVTRGDWRVAAGGFRTPIGTDVTPVDTDGDVDAVAGTGHDLLLRVARVHRWSGGQAEVQAGVLWGAERGTVDAPAISRLLSVAQQPILAFRNDGTAGGTVRAAGARARASTGALVQTASTLFSLEGALLSQRVEQGARMATPVFVAGAVRAARVWNGKRVGAQEIVPGSSRGAVEFGARAGMVEARGDALSALVTRASATAASTAGVAFSWLPSTLTRMTVGYDVTVRRAGTAPREHALLARWQQGF